MPILKSAKKALKHDIRNKKLNDAKKRSMKEAVKAFRAAPTKKTLSNAYSKIDTAKKKKLLHKNKAARLKSLLSKLLVRKS